MFDRALLSLPGINRMLALLGALSALKAAAIVGQAATLAWAITNLWNGAAFDQQLGLVAGFLGCFLARQAAVVAQDASLSRYAARQGARLRTELLECAFTGTVGWVSVHGTAKVATSALDGITQVENYLRVVLPKLLDTGIIVPVTLVAAFVLDWPSGIILLVVIPVIIFYMIMLGRMAQERATRQFGAYQVMSNHFIDTLRGLSTLKVFGAGKRQTRQVFETSERFRRATVKTLRVATLSSVVLDLFATLGVAAVAMMLGFRLVDGSLDLFTGLATLIIAPEYFAPLREFAGDFHASLDGKNALQNIQQLIAGSGQDGQDEPTPLPRFRESSVLAFEGLAFAYPEGDAGASADAGDAGDANRETLRDVSFAAHGFERIALIGESGSGKSTLARILGGFHAPDAGRITFDGMPVSLDALQGDAWRRQVIYIPQDPYIFHASLRDNIAFYTPDATDDEIASAVAAMGLEQLVAELPEGLDTPIGEGGHGLSGGQAHRIALARALLDRDRRILIFDEPTAHLDIETEYELKARMLPLMEGRLVIFATHRLHWLSEMDRTLVLRNGKVSEISATKPSRAPGHGVRGEGFHAQTVLAWSNSPLGCSSRCGTARGTPPPGPAVTDSQSQDSEASDVAARRRAGWGADRGNDQWVRPYFGLYRKTLAQALGLGIAAAAFAALLMFTAGYLIAGTAEARGSILFYYLPIAFVQLFGLGKPLLRYFERLASHDWVFRMTSSLRVRLFKVLERQALLQRSGTGEVLGVVTEDIGHIQNLYLRCIFPLVIANALVVLAALAFGVFSPWFALVMLCALALVTLGVPLLLRGLTRRQVQDLKARQDRLYRSLTDNLMGASDWVFSGRGSSCLRQTADDAAEVRSLQERLDSIQRITAFACTSFLALCFCLTLWWAALRFGGTVGGEANWIAAFALGLFPLMELFASLPAAAVQANVHRIAITHLNEFPAEDDVLKDEPTRETESRAASELAIEGLSFSYRGEHVVIDGIDLIIPAGQRVALLGRSGSGKSTLASLVRGDLAPDAGCVRVDGADVRTLGDLVAGRIGVVQQSPYLFNRTLRENLAIGKPDASDEELWDVLRAVKLEAMVQRLPHGLNTRVNETGSRFSGGERQRLALARVLLANTPIVLLDEPTVGLDPDTEQSILDTLMQATRGKTLLMITHHLQGIEAFDRVVFLEDGRIELDGAPHELQQASERYRRLIAFDRAGA